MNGEMYQICRIVAAAKSALKEHTDLLFTPTIYENKVEFQLLPLKELAGVETQRAFNVTEWYACCVGNGLQDIKLLTPVTVANRNSLGFSNSTECLLVCFYEAQVTCFTPYWAVNSEKKTWDVLYTEHEWENVPQGRPGFADESACFFEVLINIKEFANKIGCDNFAKTFQRAIDILEGTSDNIDTEYGLPLPTIPKGHLRIFEAASAADVFGAMGSWNDTPAYLAREKNLEKEYDDLSNELLKQVRLAILFAINEW